MIVDKYKNIKEQDVNLEKDLVIYGNNGVGKSNFCKVLAFNLIGERYNEQDFSQVDDTKENALVAYVSANRMFTGKSQSTFTDQNIKLTSSLIRKIDDDDYTKRVSEIIEYYYFKFNVYYQPFKSLLENIYPEYEYNDTKEEKIIYEMSDGHKSVSFILILLLTLNDFAEITTNTDKSKKYLIIDEIELNIHMSVQRNLYRVLKNRFSDYILILTTHSPVVLSEVNSDATIYEIVDGRLLEIENQYYNDLESIYENLFSTPSYNINITELLERFKRLYILYLKFNNKAIVTEISKLKKSNPELIEKNIFIKNIVGKVNNDEMQILHR